ncbi:MAG: hypothetical protein D6743_07665, partial [Calditrichaeota bacterium]
ALGEPITAETRVLRAEVVHAVREEMAVKLSDVVRRRTELGSGEHPGKAALHECAALMAEELGWSKERMRDEIRETGEIYNVTEENG